MRFSYLRFLVETYYDIQDQRIVAQNRLRSYQDAKEAERRDELQQTSEWVDQRFDKIERETKAKILREVRRYPLARDYMLKIKGVGPCIAAAIIAYYEDVERFSTISKFWAYAGQHVVDGHAPKRKKGELANWSPNLRRILWLASESFVKVKSSPYRPLYDEFKAFYQTKFPEQVDSGKKNKQGKPIMLYTKMHIHNMAKRKVVKVFLSHIWLTWREMQGLSVEPPYIIGRDGHSHMIPPPVASHSAIETQRPRASQKNSETQMEVASQSGCEAQVKPASQSSCETHSCPASHSVPETHGVVASQKKSEAQTSPAGPIIV
jgi:hypothetical protein